VHLHTCTLAHLHTCTPVHSTPLAKTWLHEEPIIANSLSHFGLRFFFFTINLLTGSMFSVMQFSRDRLL
jgi:hypothetical protein